MSKDPKPSATDPASLRALDRLVGAWDTEATHPMMPGVVVKGSATYEWLAGGKFLIQRSHSDHPEFPDAVAVIGYIDRDRDDAHGGKTEPSGPMTMEYFDSRGVFRIFQADADDKAFRFWRDSPGFSQRFTGTYSDGGDTMGGVSQLSTDDKTWKDDLAITYRRRR